ncbi:hypothetical protein AMECASPLE_036647, partial [Ameca splendens]
MLLVSLCTTTVTVQWFENCLFIAHFHSLSIHLSSRVNNLAERHCPDHLEDKQWQPLHFWRNRGGNYAG